MTSNNYWMSLSSKEKQDKKARFNKIYKTILEEGGGGESTTDYNKLLNRPKIGNEVVEGEHSPEYYNLVGNDEFNEKVDNLMLLIDQISGDISNLETNKQNVLEDDGANKNFAKIKVNGTTHSLLGGADVEIESAEQVKSYNELDDQPQIEGVTLINNKTAEDLDLVKQDTFDSELSSLETKINKKQETLIDEGDDKNFAKIKVNGTPKSLLDDEDVEITTGGGGVTSYEDLEDIPSLDGIDWKGVMDSDDFNLAKKEDLETVETTLDNKIEDKQDKLEDEGAEKNFAQLKVNNVNKSLLDGTDITINTEDIDYEKAKNKPSVAGNVLEGDKYPAQLGLASKSEVEAKQEKLVDSGSGKNFGQLKVNGVSKSLIDGDVTINTEDIDYDKAKNKPQIGGVTLEGSKFPAQLGLASATEVFAKQDKLYDSGEGKNLAKVYVNDKEYSLINNAGEDVYIPTATKEDIFSKLAIDGYFIVAHDKFVKQYQQCEIKFKIFDKNGDPVKNERGWFVIRYHYEKWEDTRSVTPNENGEVSYFYTPQTQNTYELFLVKEYSYGLDIAKRVQLMVTSP